METWEWLVLVAGTAVVLVLALAWIRIRRRRSRLKEQFGSEYGRAVADSGTGAAERRLSELRDEHDELEVRTLPQAARDRYLDEWRQAEARFVSDPRDAARTAQSLVLRVLEERGYPREDDERLVGLVAVDHPDVADRYRHGRAMLDGVDGAEGTENLRKAMLDFRAVLDEVLHARAAA